MKTPSRGKAFVWMLLSITFSLSVMPTLLHGQSFKEKEQTIKVDDSYKIQVPGISLLYDGNSHSTVQIFDTKGGTAKDGLYKFEAREIHFSKDLKALSIPSISAKVDSGIIGKSVILAIKDDKNNILDYHTLRFVKKEDAKSKSLDGYYIAGGTSFDFVDGLQLAKPSWEMNVFLPALFRLSKHDSSPRWGFEGNIYRHRSVSQIESTTTRIHEEPLFPPVKDTLKIRRQTGHGTSTTKIDNLGLSLGTNLLLGNNELVKSQKNGFRAFWLTHMEVIQSTIKTTLDSVTVQKVDTFTVNIKNRLVLRRDFDARSYTSAGAYFGSGLMLNYYNDDCDIRIKGLLGVNDRGFKNPMFFLVNFNFVEKNSGIRLGGNVRGDLAGSQPYIDIYLQKVFSANDILAPLLKKLK